jgi:glycolate dehydrogenase FAD-binding subunit
MMQARSSSATGTTLEIPWEQLRAIVGAPNLRPAAPEDNVLGVQPQMIAEPGDEQEMAATLKWVDQVGLAVVPRGGGTKLDWGNPPVRADLVLSTARLNHILEHAWADMTATVEAGVTVQALQDALGQHGQRLAIDPLFPEHATIGGLLSTNDSGTLRLRFGALRDLIIGATIALPDGTIASSGGKVVKNVAGYDLPKLVTGALGTLGVITRAVFRLYPAPRAARSLTFAFDDVKPANELLLAVQASKLAHTGLQLRVAGEGKPEIDVRFAGTEAGMDAQSATLRNLTTPARESGNSLAVWQSLQNLWSSANECAIAKFSVLPAQVAATCEHFRRITGTSNLDWRAIIQGTGLGWIRLESPDAAVLRSTLRSLRSQIQPFVILRRPTTMAALDAWGDPGDSFPLMLAVKQQFDPNGTLNRGRFLGGI